MNLASPRPSPGLTPCLDQLQLPPSSFFTWQTPHRLLEPRSKVPSCVILEALAEADPGAVLVIKPTSEGLVILYLEALLPANL